MARFKKVSVKTDGFMVKSNSFTQMDQLTLAHGLISKSMVLEHFTTKMVLKSQATGSKVRSRAYSSTQIIKDAGPTDRI